MRHLRPSRKPRRSIPVPARRGSMLTLFAVLLFALLPLIALIVHTGFVTLTRRQMQTAVNTAAKEGLRIELSSAAPAGSSRSDVSTLVSLVFDDDLNTAADSQDMTLGAGPVVTFTDGTPITGSNFRASRQISGANLGVYQPVLQTNTGNAAHGDMIVGDYDATGTHSEDSSYTRDDFFPDGAAGHVANDAFLARMRRTDNAGSLDELAGISSRGAPVPHLFGRVPYGNADGGTTLLDQRERGSIVRAAAIAQTQPVVTVGVPSANVDEGLALFEIDSGSWAGLTNGTPVLVTLQADGSITGGLTGRFVTRALTTLGDQTTGLGSIPSDLEINSNRVAAIKASINGTDRVVGLGMAVLTESAGNHFITRLAADNNVPFQNAVSTFVEPVAVSGTDFTDVWNAFQATPERALAGALARSIR